jgi:chromosome segregation ATPase
VTSLEERLEQIAKKLARQAEDLKDLEKGDESSDSDVRNLRKELSDLKRAAQITPQFTSRAAPVLIGTASTSRILPTEIEKAIQNRLAGTIGETDLYKSFGLIRKKYD